MKFPKTGNRIWFNRAFLYYKMYDGDPLFVAEMYWLMQAVGAIPEISNKI